MPDAATYLAIGALVGFLAGLLGIGGGVIIVSSLAIIYGAHGFAPQYTMHLAIGTSLAAIMAGAWSSFRAHGRRDAVDWAIVRGMSPGLLVGVMAGSLVARFMNGVFLKFFFLAFMAFVVLQLLLDLKPKTKRELPGRTGLALVSFFIGVCSGWFGGGAAAIGVPFLTWCSVGVHRAIGTVAALGFVVALAGTLGYAISGWSVPGLPPWSLGFVYVPAAIGISVTSALTAPLGVRLAHRLPPRTLRRVFAAFLILVGLKVALSV
ncbi:MAG TPA: sulfite exporter TauE/SafE family protein [Usitatibacter sp.]|nr:sulfite exporter TauE/SafE family protein [Usitatibacter sp.]